MKILILNAGSSSLKFQLYAINSSVEEEYQLLASGLIEQIAETNSSSSISYLKAQKLEHFREKNSVADHSSALEVMMDLLKEKCAILSITELSGIGHRVVHGGEIFSEPVMIDEQVISAIDQLGSLAPLHNPPNLTGIKLARLKAPLVPQVAVFDTSFHQSIPEYAYIYALPYSLYENHQVRRYGFHGTSHFYVSQQATAYLRNQLHKEHSQFKFISIHLGNGGSATAIQNGRSIDTSMGMTPLEGLVMGTRSGTIDPAIIFHLHRETGISFDELDLLLNKQSGLKGICGENDMRTIVKLAEQGNRHAKLAIDIFCYQIKKYIGAYLAVLNGADAIIFTGGIGENSSLIRALSCQHLENMGIQIDSSKNHQQGNKQIMEIQTDSSPVKILVIATNEELEIAKQTINLIKK